MFKSYLLSILLITSFPCFCQMRVGILGGVHGASVKESNNIPGWDSTVKPNFSGRTGVHLGFLVEIPLDVNQRWYFHPAMLYMAKGRKYLQNNDTTQAQMTDTLSIKSNFFTNYIDIPLNIAYKLPIGKKTKLILSAGPYFALFLNGKRSLETRAYTSNQYNKEESDIDAGNAENKVRTLDFGFNARAGFDFGGVLLTGFYSKGLTDFYTAPYDGSFKHQVVGASLGFWLNKATPLPPKDKDKDGIPDLEDACPDQAGTAGTGGCPDKDADLVPDNTDKCADIPGLAKYQGCPIPDTDKDGINDESDACPDKPGIEKYKGCPIPDTDGDGISDEADACPDKAGTPDFNGCPVPDSDGDGVNDKEDKCPTESGLKENNGCPEIKKEIIEKVNYAAKNIFFKLNSEKLDAKSFEALDELTSILSSDPSLKLLIEGHTDNTGAPEYNLQLSQKRTDAVKKYLVNKGIDGSRLVSQGYGQEKPLADNKTASGRSQNRRVELKVQNQ